MSSYTIQINELQRLCILEALVAAFGEVPANFLPGANYLNEGPVLRDLLRDLPASEAQTPNCLHGLCL